jgi:hypothetical protein
MYGSINVASSAVKDTVSAVPGLDGSIKGRGLERRALSTGQRVGLAVSAVQGTLCIHSLTVTQASELFRVPRHRISEGYRQSRQRPPSPTNDIDIDKVLERVIAKYGADALLRALDRYTTPRFSIAAE